MEPFKYNVGDIVKVIDGGRTYPFLASIFEKLNFKNKIVNSWKWRDTGYKNREELYFITDRIIHLEVYNVYKIICITDSTIEYLIEEKGIEKVGNAIQYKNIKII